ncbi:MAG: uroporphyrinogen decarboxylase family protein [Candidatus Helarchaeota archaeon]
MSPATSWDLVMDAIALNEGTVPVIPQLTYAAAFFLDMGIDEALSSIEKQKKALLNAQKKGGYDGIYAGWEGSFTLVSNALGAPVKTYRDKPPSVDKPLVKTKADLTQLPPLDPANSPQIQLNLKLITELKEATQNIPILSYIPAPFTLGSLLMGVNDFMVTLMRDKEHLLEDLLQYTYQTTLEFAKAKIEAGVDMITIADPSGSSSLVAPRHFAKFSQPLLTKLISELKKQGIKVGLHICGNTKPILTKMLETGADYLEIDAEVDLKEAQELIDRKKCLVGNISPSDLAMKAPQEIKQQAETLVKTMEPGFILSSGCEIAYGTPLVNIQAMVQTTKHMK